MPGLGDHGGARIETTADSLEMAISKAAIDSPTLFDGMADKEWGEFLQRSWRELREGRVVDGGDG